MEALKRTAYAALLGMGVALGLASQSRQSLLQMRCQVFWVSRSQLLRMLPVCRRLMTAIIATIAIGIIVIIGAAIIIPIGAITIIGGITGTVIGTIATGGITAGIMTTTDPGARLALGWSAL